MTDFLLELRSEEIPARMQVKAKDDLARLFAEEIAKAGLAATAIETFATPRRLALIARGLPDATDAVSEERKGPRSNAPEQAVAGFLRSTGLTREQLVERDGVFFAVIDKPGRATAEVLAEAITAVIPAFPWPTSMRWGDGSLTTESLRWVRPLQGIVALFGETIVPCEVDGIVSGAATMGHRFHHSGPITIGSAADYVEKLRDAHVIVHLSERTTLIRDGARAAAAAAGLTLVEDEGLVIENAGLTEWPVPLPGRFDAAFLDVPREVIQLTMRTNQKYFACVEPNSAALSLSKGDSREPGFDKLTPAETLANAFVCTANIDASDGGKAIVAGNERVLSARLSDAKFFWENDLKVPLEVQAAKLNDIVFHEKLGTVADKVERVAKLARWLVESGVVTIARHPGPRAGVPLLSVTGAEGSGTPDQVRGDAELASLAERAALLCKADLVTGMVGEFPELQGIIGGHLARAQGEAAQVADAIRDHYKPVGQGDDVPTDPVTVAVSLADKLDTLFSFFMAGDLPTGSKDPFALRRSALSALSIIEINRLRLNFSSLLQSFYRHWIYWWRSEDRYVAVVEGWRHEVPDTGETYSVLIHSPFCADSPLDYMPEYGEGTWLIELYGYDDTRELSDYELEGVRTLKFVRFAAFSESVLAFLADRLKVQQREAGVRHDLIDAVFALGGEDDLVRLLARVKALQAFVTTAEGADLLAGYKRAANILKKEGVASTSARHPGPRAGVPLSDGTDGEVSGTPDQVRGDGGLGTGALTSPLSYTPEPCEAALIAALGAADPRVGAAIDAEDFEGAMTALSTLRTPIDAFFENVTVNDADADKRAARLGLLARFRDAVHRVADFSKIEG